MSLTDGQILLLVTSFRKRRIKADQLLDALICKYTYVLGGFYPVYLYKEFKGVPTTLSGRKESKLRVKYW